ncbi:MAG: DUF58 domain-containing protein [Lachnospiraceae bacterium]|nr:DUF58 domain-containing protein [Lachnospiraceae bacterium]
MYQFIAILILAAILYTVQRVVYMKLWAKNLEVDIRFEGKEIFEGERGRLVETITNGKRLPLPMIKCKFLTSRNLMFDNATVNQNTDNYYRNDVFTLGGRERLTRTIAFKAAKRGLYNINNAELVGTDMFFTLETVLMKKVYDEIYVLPRPFNTNEFRNSLQWINGEIKSKAHLIEDPFEFRGIREYQPYDSMKSINWKATAKTGELRVNMRDFTSQKVVRIFLNLEDEGIIKRTEAQEAAIKVAAGLVRMFTQEDMEFALYSNGVDCLSHQPIKIKRSRGRVHEQEIYRALARINLKEETQDMAKLFSDTIEAGDGTMCDYHISVNSYNKYQNMLENYDSLHLSFLWLYVTSGAETIGISSKLQTRTIPIRSWSFDTNTEIDLDKKEA